MRNFNWYIWQKARLCPPKQNRENLSSSFESRRNIACRSAAMRKIYARISPLITSPPATNGPRRTRHHPPAPYGIRRGAPLNAYHARGTWHGRDEKKAGAGEISRRICRPSSRASRRDTGWLLRVVTRRGPISV